jgi:hypothetical protein
MCVRYMYAYVLKAGSAAIDRSIDRSNEWDPRSIDWAWGSHFLFNQAGRQAGRHQCSRCRWLHGVTDGSGEEGVQTQTRTLYHARFNSFFYFARERERERRLGCLFMHLCVYVCVCVPSRGARIIIRRIDTESIEAICFVVVGFVCLGRVCEAWIGSMPAISIFEV